MKRLIIVAALIFSPALALATQVLVQTTSTRVDQNTGTRRGIELQNLGPNTIWCNVGTSTVVANQARRIQSGEAWAINVSAGQRVYCLAETANQVSGAATIVTEAR